jgi:hypothetical protein
MSNLKILKLNNAHEDSPEVFEKLKGRRFVAISITDEDVKGKSYEYHVNHMTDEEVVYAAALLLNQRLEDDR